MVALRWRLSCSVSLGAQSEKALGFIQRGNRRMYEILEWHGMNKPLPLTCRHDIWMSVDFCRLSSSILAGRHMLVLHSAQANFPITILVLNAAAQLFICRISG